MVSAAAMVFVDDLAAPELPPAEAHHLVNVLRLRSDEVVIASDGAGGWMRCHLKGVGPGVTLVADDEPRAEARPEPTITIAFALAKGDRPEWVAQKLTELGVDRIVPLHTTRSVVRWQGERGARAVERLRRVTREAAAQCRRTWLPEVTTVLDLDALADWAGSPPLLAHPGGNSLVMGDRVVAVGPEGGWDEAELARWDDRVGLGPTVLRSETAAVAAGAVLCAVRSGVVGELA